MQDTLVNDCRAGFKKLGGGGGGKCPPGITALLGVYSAVYTLKA